MDKPNNIEIGDKTEVPISGGLFVKDTKQINEDFAKNKAKITETEVIKSSTNTISSIII